MQPDVEGGQKIQPHHPGRAATTKQPHLHKSHGVNEGQQNREAPEGQHMGELQLWRRAKTRTGFCGTSGRRLRHVAWTSASKTIQSKSVPWLLAPFLGLRRRSCIRLGCSPD